MRYTACGGLINQQYSHIAAFALAEALHAEIVLPPAVMRDSFAHYFRCGGAVRPALVFSIILGHAPKGMRSPTRSPEFRTLCALHGVPRRALCADLLMVSGGYPGSPGQAGLCVCVASPFLPCLPPSSTFKEKNEVHWTPAPLETLLDVEAIVEAWGAQGMVVHKVEASLTRPRVPPACS